MHANIYMHGEQDFLLVGFAFLSLFQSLACRQTGSIGFFSVELCIYIWVQEGSSMCPLARLPTLFGNESQSQFIERTSFFFLSAFN